jgi:hypothetical protein
MDIRPAGNRHLTDRLGLSRPSGICVPELESEPSHITIADLAVGNSGSSYQFNLLNISILTSLCSLFPEFTMSLQAVPVGNMLPKRCHKVEGMFFIPDGRCKVRCFRGAQMTELALGGRDFPKRPVGLQHELHNTGDVDCHVQTLLSPPPPGRPRYHDSEPLAPQAAVSRSATV